MSQRTTTPKLEQAFAYTQMREGVDGGGKFLGTFCVCLSPMGQVMMFIQTVTNIIFCSAIMEVFASILTKTLEIYVK